MATPRAWLLAFLVTVVVETPIVVWLTRQHPASAPRRTALAIFAQLATHPLVWFVFPHIVGLTGRTSLLLSETWAWAAETAFYLVALPGLPVARAVATSALANAASIAVGLAVF
jgi:hypothetical protein